jgi:putative lipoic acid-binding regulatory protein
MQEFKWKMSSKGNYKKLQLNIHFEPVNNVARYQNTVQTGNMLYDGHISRFLPSACACISL